MYNFYFFITALFEEWKKQLGNYMIDYNTLIVKEIIAKGVRILTTYVHFTGSDG